MWQVRGEDEEGFTAALCGTLFRTEEQARASARAWCHDLGLSHYVVRYFTERPYVYRLAITDVEMGEVAEELTEDYNW